MKTVLSIAGSDSSGGAGIQADIKTISAHGVYAMTAVTALTAQNTTGVRSILEATPGFVADQLDAVFEDIRPDAVKIGMVSSGELIEVIAEKLERYRARHVVVDPVMVATSGSALMKHSAIKLLSERLMPIAELATPNIPETEALTGNKIRTKEDMEKAAQAISEKCGCAVLIKGGHQLNDANDFLYSACGKRWFTGQRIDNPNTHGTGCTLSSAIASNLAKGDSIEEAVEKAKRYISGALRDMLNLGKGSGPLNHLYALRGEFTGVKG